MTPPPGSTVCVWKCETCGRWSFAKRRPLRHKRSEVIADGDYSAITQERICGPFRRYVATRTDEVGPALPEHGRVINEWEHVEDPNAGIEVPF